MLDESASLTTIGYTAIVTPFALAIRLALSGIAVIIKINGHSEIDTEAILDACNRYTFINLYAVYFDIEKKKVQEANHLLEPS